ncbi:MAG: isoprenyl transferase [Verrucomicrobiota bacterium]
MTQSVEQSEQNPRHIAIIMDGNGRWAHRHNKPRIEGHRAGAEAVRRVVEECSELGVEFLTLYAFSSENWKRPPDEVRYLMNLLQDFLEQYQQDFDKHEIRLNVVGDIQRLPGFVRRRLNNVMKKTAHYQRGVLTLALSYGGRDEIVKAARRMAEEVADGKLGFDEFTEDKFASYLYTTGLPDPDLLIRTSGEQRLSNFMLWQSSYTELWFTERLWPDFGKQDLQEAVTSYRQRTRRFGGR